MTPLTLLGNCVRSSRAQFSTITIALPIGLLVSSCLAAPIKVVPLGDSLTQARGSQAANGGYNYRYELSKLFVDAGIDFDFVGSLDTNWQGDPMTGFPSFRDQSFDNDHEGHWGWTAQEIANGPGSKGRSWGSTSGSVSTLRLAR